MQIERNYGVDLLKIVSMYMVILLHILGNGGVLGSAVISSANYDIAWFVETAAFCAVNCFALASGYVGIESQHKYSNILRLWINVFYYNVLVFVVFAILNLTDVSLGGIIKLAFPVSNSDYWYFSAYFVLFFFIPILNAGINNISKRDHLISVIVLGVLFTVLNLFFNGSYFGVGSGYSAFWLIFLYIVGAYLKKYVAVNKFKTKILLAFIMIFCIILSYMGYMAWSKYHLFAPGGIPEKACMNIVRYSSPTILIIAIALLLIFANLKINNKVLIKIIQIVAPAAFSVYLIQAAPLVWMAGNNKFLFLIHMLAGEMILKLFGYAILIYCICIAIDYIRIFLFRLLKVSDRIKIIDK